MSPTTSGRDRLFLLRPDFTDPAYPGRAAGIDVERVAWERPRRDVIAVAGEANQSLPLLVLGSGAGSLSGKDAILAHLAKRYGCPEPHP